MIRILRWVLGEIWEKINIPATFREIKALGKKHGARFFWMALIWELIEDGLFPLLSWKFGVPELIPLFLIFHFEPVVYPIFFWCFRMWDRFRGREPKPNELEFGLRNEIPEGSPAGWGFTNLAGIECSLSKPVTKRNRKEKQADSAA